MQLFLDTTALALVVGPNDTRRTLPPIITIGDKAPVTLTGLVRNPQPLNTGNPVYNYVDLSSAAIVLSIGPAANAPTNGSFTLTFGANTTPAQPWNVDCITLGNALNALASIVAAGGVTVTGPIGGPFYVTFGTLGVQSTLLTVGTNSLYPATGITITRSQTGTAALAEVQAITLQQQATAKVTAWTPQSAPAITVTSINGTVTQRVAIPAGTYGGTFTLTLNGNTTTPIPFAAQLDVVAAAINALPGVTGATVWPGQNFWDITIPGNTFAITGTATGLIVPLNLSGTLDLSTQQVADLLAGAASAQVPLLIQQTAGGNTLTYYSGMIQLNAPLQ
jgi:hypothetical protein